MISLYIVHTGNTRTFQPNHKISPKGTKFITEWEVPSDTPIAQLLKDEPGSNFGSAVVLTFSVRPDFTVGQTILLDSKRTLGSYGITSGDTLVAQKSGDFVNMNFYNAPRQCFINFTQDVTTLVRRLSRHLIPTQARQFSLARNGYWLPEDIPLFDLGLDHQSGHFEFKRKYFFSTFKIPCRWLFSEMASECRQLFAKGIWKVDPEHEMTPELNEMLQTKELCTKSQDEVFMEAVKDFAYLGATFWNSKIWLSDGTIGVGRIGLGTNIILELNHRQIIFQWKQLKSISQSMNAQVYRTFHHFQKVKLLIGHHSLVPEVWFEIFRLLFEVSKMLVGLDFCGGRLSQVMIELESEMDSFLDFCFQAGLRSRIKHPKK